MGAERKGSTEIRPSGGERQLLYLRSEELYPQLPREAVWGRLHGGGDSQTECKGDKQRRWERKAPLVSQQVERHSVSQVKMSCAPCMYEGQCQAGMIEDIHLSPKSYLLCTSWD
jgi:hypothetical protein